MADTDPSWQFKIADIDEPKQEGYDEWKRALILRSLEEAKDRKNMIPAEEVWKSFGFED